MLAFGDVELFTTLQLCNSTLSAVVEGIEIRHVGV
jgi:hypothetical protein